MRFSERIGKKPIKVDIQLDSMDEELRISLWNVIEFYVNKPLKAEDGHIMSDSRFNDIFNTIWFSFFKEPIDNIPINKYALIDELRKRFFAWTYLDVYDFFDFIVQCRDLPLNRDAFIEDSNFVLQRELSGYRIINGILAPLTNENEILEIEKAINNTEVKRYEGANIHLAEALNKLSDRKNPDYRNSIKESISAIESICQVISNNPKADLGTALKKLKTSIPIHPALEQGFLKIYGYTSDGNGIRHALLEEHNLGQEDALFMLIASSAFVNYLIAKANRT